MSIKRLPWWKRYISDWRAGTRGMSLELKGFYGEVLDAQWDLHTQLPLDDKKLAMMLDCNPRSVRKLMPQLVALGKIVRTSTGYYNPRMMRDILGVGTLPEGGEFASASPRIEPEVEPKPSRIQPEVDPNSHPIQTEFGSKVAKNPMFSTRDSRGQTPEARDQSQKEKSSSSQSVIARDAAAAAGFALTKRLIEITGADEAKLPGLATCAIPTMWLVKGFDPDRHIVPTVQRLVSQRRRQSPDWAVRTWGYFTAAIADAAEADKRGLQAIDTSMATAAATADAAKQARIRELMRRY